MKVNRIISYLTFSGNCREAMLFYQSCFGGQLEWQTVGDSPLAKTMPPSLQQYIIQSTLTNEQLSLMGTDITPSAGLKKGNSVSLLLYCRSEKELQHCFEKLSAGGIGEQPPAVTHWGALFGGLTDKFGHHWLLHCDKPGF